MNIKAIGLIEVSGSVAAIDALDIMCKAANVTLVTWEKKLGGRLVTVIVTGDVSDRYRWILSPLRLPIPSHRRIDLTLLLYIIYHIKSSLF